MLNFTIVNTLIFSILHKNLIQNYLRPFRITWQRRSRVLRKSIFCSDTSVCFVLRFAQSESLPIHSAPVMEKSPSGLTICFDGNQLFFLLSHLHFLLLQFYLKFPCNHGSDASDETRAWSQLLQHCHQCISVHLLPRGVAPCTIGALKFHLK